MKRSRAILFIVLALLLGFGAAIGLYVIEKNKAKIKITQLQGVNLQNIYRLNEFRAITGFNNLGQTESLFYVRIEQSLPLQLQLSLLAESLSQFCFAFLPIEVYGIQEYDGKKVAVINLKEFDDFVRGKPYHGSSWAHQHFQGSTGGRMTTTILIESFLQRDNMLPWIDGVVFLYEENTIREFEHVDLLSQTNFR